MVINEPVAERSGTSAFGSAPLVAVDANFDTRWAAWIARGEVHDRRVRRRFVASAAVIAIGAAIALTYLA
jgi:hypothetical protein